ncbi:hypothetical protein AAFF_G00429240 [Aldrovandia affinis]|uniref:UBA domain-containing protein n=1 Tax=Aldrovandia affinis TaxID=143900 RepID=A0AAD7WJJ3_9TELE|nr:hypothetical protein AAFF_G00429240 [Aldrovandia affinis]
MFSSPQVSRLASRASSDLWHPPPRPRSHSLSAAAQLLHPRVKLLIADPEGDQGYSEDDEGSSAEEEEEEAMAVGPDAPGRQPPPRPGPPPRHAGRLQKSLSSSPEFRQRPPQAHGQRRPRRRLSSVGRHRSLSPQPPASSSPAPPCDLQPRPSTAGPLPSRGHAPQSLRPYSCLPPPPSGSLRSRGSPPSVPDSSEELLSALGQEERELLEAITAQGYPLRTAIIALQKTGQQSLEKILSYLVTCDRLCDLGYDAVQVEEALEMFHNCEAKAAEFLRLLAQFHEMGFQQNAIKEVLLVNENHRERALEELMARVA